MRVLLVSTATFACVAVSFFKYGQRFLSLQIFIIRKYMTLQRYHLDSKYTNTSDILNVSWKLEAAIELGTGEMNFLIQLIGMLIIKSCNYVSRKME